MPPPRERRTEYDILSSDGLESYVMQDEERQKRDRSNTLTVPESLEKRRKRTVSLVLVAYILKIYYRYSRYSYLLSLSRCALPIMHHDVLMCDAPAP